MITTGINKASKNGKKPTLEVLEVSDVRWHDESLDDVAVRAAEPIRVEAPWHDESLDDGGEPSRRTDHEVAMPETDATSARRAVLGLPDREGADVPPRAAVLREAEGLITGDRNQSYGTPTQNFTNIAELWSIQFQDLLKDGAKFTAAQVAQAQIHVKMARMIAQPKRDNYVDVAGYAGCGWESEAAAQ